MTKAEIINQLSLATGYDKKTVTVIVEGFMSKVKENIIKGENVFFRGFGSFVTKKRAEKIARNISKQTTVKVPAHRVVDFKPAAEFKEAVRPIK